MVLCGYCIEERKGEVEAKMEGSCVSFPCYFEWQAPKRSTVGMTALHRLSAGRRLVCISVCLSRHGAEYCAVSDISLKNDKQTL